MNFLAVGLGGALGALLRYLVWLALRDHAKSFPCHTLAVNLVGCLAIGWLVFGPLASTKSDILRLFLVVGVLGGFTTFSAFGLETVELFRAGRVLAATLYIALSVALGLLGVSLGYAITSRS